MRITVNGKVREFEGGTLLELIGENGRIDAKKVMASVNGAIVSPEDYATLTLSENDQVDFFSFVPGG